ncbi:unnamed protein product [Owenia fusiformis]|uniref:UV-stimulated scaffold protein A C-terminal domain-containing protein n=1 Tax=Owenia fusiformis TaxID=6347 RepID=A0A8S4PH10_OWEFU|nr:unnamed protein product [Owenia fusiformis]
MLTAYLEARQAILTLQKTIAMDPALHKQLTELIEQLTHSGEANLESGVMKQIKNICRKSDLYVELAFDNVMIELQQDHAEIRLSAFQIINELFTRSHRFRELLIQDFHNFTEHATNVNPDNPLPKPKPVAKILHTKALETIQQWKDKYGEAYKKLTLGYHYLKQCRKVDFDDMEARSVAERLRQQEEEARKEAIINEKCKTVLKQMEEIPVEVQSALTEMDSCYKLLLPDPEQFTFHEAEKDNDDKDHDDKNNDHKDDDYEDNEYTDNDDKDNDDEDNDEKDDDEKDNDVGISSHGNYDRKDTEKACELRDECDQNPNDHQNIPTENNGNNDRDKTATKRDATNWTETEDSDAKRMKSVIELENGDTKNKSDDDRDSDKEYDDDDMLGLTTQTMRERGIGSQRYAVEIQLDTSMLTVVENNDNTDILSTLTDLYRLTKGKYLPRIGQWLDLLTKGGKYETQIKRAIDIKQALLSATNKYEKLDIRFMPQVKVQTDSNRDSDSDSDFEDVAEKEGFEADIPEHLREDYGILPSTKPAYQEIDMFAGSGNLADNDLDSTIMKTNERIQKRLQSGPSSSKPRGSALLSKPPSAASSSQGASDVPVVPYGVDLFHWENRDEIKPTIVRYDSLHRFWTPRENDEQIDKEAEAAMKNRVINFTGEFQPVQWSCRALLSNGRLCPRMDRIKCPFHGKIIGRDKTGAPSNPNDCPNDKAVAGKAASSTTTRAQPSQATSSETQDWRDPELQRDIEAATGINLTQSKKGKGRGKKTSNLTNINKLENTSRKRLEKKVLNARTLKRVSGKLDQIDQKLARDKFASNFNYSM